MHKQVETPKEDKSKAIANSVTQKKSNAKQGFAFVDNRPEAVVQRKMRNLLQFRKKIDQPTKQCNNNTFVLQLTETEDALRNNELGFTKYAKKLFDKYRDKKSMFVGVGASAAPLSSLMKVAGAPSFVLRLSGLSKVDNERVENKEERQFVENWILYETQDLGGGDYDTIVIFDAVVSGQSLRDVGIAIENVFKTKYGKTPTIILEALTNNRGEDSEDSMAINTSIFEGDSDEDINKLGGSLLDSTLKTSTRDLPKEATKLKNLMTLAKRYLSTEHIEQLGQQISLAEEEDPGRALLLRMSAFSILTHKEDETMKMCFISEELQEPDMLLKMVGKDEIDAAESDYKGDGFPVYTVEGDSYNWLKERELFTSENPSSLLDTATFFHLYHNDMRAYDWEEKDKDTYLENIAKIRLQLLENLSISLDRGKLIEAYWKANIERLWKT